MKLFPQKPKHWIAGMVGLAVSALGIVAGGQDQHATVVPGPAARPALTVRTTMLQPAQWVRRITANGSIIPWQEAIISAQLQGVRIAEVRVSIGDEVKKGDVLVTLDNLAGGQEEAGGARSVQGRVVAPDDGIISSANANVGSMVQPGAELFRLIRKGRLEWRAELTAEELMLLRRGMSAEVRVGEDRVLKGKVRAISPSVDARTRYGYALISLEDSRGVIAGMYANGIIEVSAGRRTVQTLPQSALMRRGRHTYVLVVDATGRVHERPVRTGQSVGERIEIREGLKPGEEVVETGGAFLTEGDTVQVLK